MFCTKSFQNLVAQNNNVNSTHKSPVWAGLIEDSSFLLHMKLAGAAQRLSAAIIKSSVSQWGKFFASPPMDLGNV